MPARVIAILLLILVISPSHVEAATIPCVVDESGLYVSGRNVGEYDEDLNRNCVQAAVVVSHTKPVFDWSGALSVLMNLLSSEILIKGTATVLIVVALLGFILVGGSSLQNV